MMAGRRPERLGDPSGLTTQLQQMDLIVSRQTSGLREPRPTDCRLKQRRRLRIRQAPGLPVGQVFVSRQADIMRLIACAQPFHEGD
jgi:hypothetical protein